jgi:hypothetical protein
LGIPVLEGREFTDRDERETKRVVVVNRLLAERLWPNESALGRRLVFEDDSEPAEVVGIVGEVRQQSLERPRDEIYIADYQNGAAWGVLFVKAEVPLHQLIKPMREALLNVDPGLPFEPREELDDRLAQEAYRGRYALGLTAVLTSIALLLTLLGIYGVAATIANSRSAELAVRTAVGALPSRLCVRIASVALLPVAAGTAAGLPLAWALGRWLGAIGHSGAADLASPTVESHVFVPLAMLGTAFVACLVAAKQALKREPWTQLTKND